MAWSRSVLLALIAVVMALALAACGDDDEGSEEDEIAAAIEYAATSGDPQACTEAQTQRFTEQTSGETGPDAVESCKEDVDAPAEEVEVENIEVDGDTATAGAALSGSTLDGQTIAISLVKEGEDWKLDEITEFVEFDRAAFDAGFEEDLRSDEQIPPQAADCITENFATRSDEEIQEFFLHPSDQLAQELFGACFGG